MYCLERPMYKLVQIELDKRSMAEQEEWCKILEKSEKAARIRATQLHFHVHTNFKFALPLTYSPTAIQPAKKVSATIMAMSKVEHGRQWIYDTGCHATSIGLKHLTSEEQKRIFSVETKGSITASGTIWTSKAVLCDVPFLGKRQCYVLPDCPPCISVNEEVDDHGSVFIWTAEDGPVTTLADGTVVYLSTSQIVPIVDGYVRTNPNERTETSQLEDFSLPMTCQPCDQPPGLCSPGSSPVTALPQMAMEPNGCLNCDSWSERIRRPKQQRLSQTALSTAAKERRTLCPERKTGMTPVITLEEDVPTIGNRHRSAVRSTSAKHGEIRPALQSWLGPSEPFFVEVFSGTGRLAAAVRSQGVVAYEFDLTEQGGRKDLLKKNVLSELRSLIESPYCLGVWFGFPCGTFSSARRNDGGPPPLRGTNSKDIWGLPHLTGRERDRVRSANKLLLRMHELMRLCENTPVPFYWGTHRRANNGVIL